MFASYQHEVLNFNINESFSVSYCARSDLIMFVSYFKIIVFNLTALLGSQLKVSVVIYWHDYCPILEEWNGKYQNPS